MCPTREHGTNRSCPPHCHIYTGHTHTWQGFRKCSRTNCWSGINMLLCAINIEDKMPWRSLFCDKDHLTVDFYLDQYFMPIYWFEWNIFYYPTCRDIWHQTEHKHSYVRNNGAVKCCHWQRSLFKNNWLNDMKVTNQNQYFSVIEQIKIKASKKTNKSRKKNRNTNTELPCMHTLENENRITF